MNLIVETTNLQNYLVEDRDIDFSHLVIREKVRQLYQNGDSEIDRVRKAFEFVRDEIAHSWDIQSTRITRRASEVLVFKEGICYAKSNLLAALLRAINIPTGFCYQRLTLGDTPETGYVIHALNAVYLSTVKKWVRLDARGNKEGVDAQFFIDREKLAFSIRTYYDEKDYAIIYKNPMKITMATLSNNINCLEMYKHGLPAEI